MINPTWQDAERRVIFVPTDYLELKDPLALSTAKDHGDIVSWHGDKVEVHLEGVSLNIEYNRKNFFWEDREGDFDEYKEIRGK